MSNKPTTYVLLVTDESGSMYRLAEDVRGGYNQYRQSLIDDADARYRVTSAIFSDDYRLLCIAAKPKDTAELDEKNYEPGGSTALLDAIGKTIVDFEKKVPKLGADDRVLLVVQTDGQENASREYDRAGITKMIKDREAGGQWACIFMGAGPDTWQQAGGMGFSTSLSYANTAAGTASAYSGLTQTSQAYSKGATRSAAAAASGLEVMTDD